MEQNIIEAGFEKVWRMFQETSRKFKETDRRFQETDRKFQETDRRFKETSMRFKETDRRFKETDRRFKETDREIKETGKLVKETNIQIQETDKKLKEVMEGLKKLEDTFITRWGRFMEVLVNSGAILALRGAGLSINHSAKNVTEQMPNGRGRGMEIDVLCWGEDIVVPIEVKTTLKVEDVDEHIERLSRFFECFPTFRGKKLYGGVAGLEFAGEADRYAYKKGLYVLTLKGDRVVEVVNDGKFRPKIWG